MNMLSPPPEERDSMRLQCPQCGNINLSGCLLLIFFTIYKPNIYHSLLLINIGSVGEEVKWDN